MQELTVPPTDVEPDLLADVYTEAFDEAEFYCEMLDAAAEDAEHTLDSLADGPERALLAMLDVLVVDASVDRRELAEGMHGGPRRRQAATMALLTLGAMDRVAEGIRDPDPTLRASAIRGCGLLRDSTLIEQALQNLDTERDRDLTLWSLELCVAYQVCPRSLAYSLQQDDPELLCMALRAARHGDAIVHRELVEALLRYPSDAVHEEAIVTGLIYHSPAAFAALRSRALHVASASPLAMQLYAALGGPYEFGELELLLDAPALRKHVVFALGFSGDSATASSLLAYLDDRDTRVAKLAFEAISTITGLDTTNEAWVRVEAPRVPGDLPPVAEDPEALAALVTPEDDLESELHEAVDHLSHPDAVEVARWLSSRSPAMPPTRRYLRGAPFGPESLSSYLTTAPLRVRHTLALSLQIRSKGRYFVDTRGLSAVQRAQIRSLASLQPAQLANPFLAY